MKLTIFSGTKLLEGQGLVHDGQVYIPASTLGSFAGLWQNTVFLHSPLAGKRICITVLSPETQINSLPPPLEHFLALLAAAGAQIIYHDGGTFPKADLILAIEPDSNHTSIQYLGAPIRSRRLAQRIAYSIKRGLRLAYLADPAPFYKPQYNLSIGFPARWFTPAVAIQWPDMDLGPWIFVSLMEHFGGDQGLDARAFARPQPLPQPDPPAPQPEATPAPEQQPRQPKPSTPKSSPKPKRPSATMSSAQYPDFFAQQRAKKPIGTQKPFG